MNIDDKLLKSSPQMLSNFVLELTDKCNLRCVYCHQNLPDFKAMRDMSEKKITQVMEYFDKVKPPFINLTGGGDLIMAPDWQKQCQRMLNYGIPLRATLNLGKLLSREETETLAKFSLLTISIDSVDQQVLRQYRKSVDIRTISQNILAIKGAANRLAIPGPQWIISSVYYAEIVPTLSEVPAYAAAMGAQFYGLQDLLEFSGIVHNVTPVWKLRGEQAMNVVIETRKALDLAEKLGLSLILPGDFRARIDQLEKDAYAHAA